jgi:hypothetical protein
MWDSGMTDGALFGGPHRDSAEWQSQKAHEAKERAKAKEMAKGIIGVAGLVLLSPVILAMSLTEWLRR